MTPDDAGTRAKRGAVDVLVGEEEIRPLFTPLTYSPASVDPLGYDIRLGSWVKLPSRGATVSLNPGQSIEVYPDETLLAVSEETLSLPVNVFGTGSPKMSLLLKGLWAHGGKTDFGYSSQLVFGFRHHGTQPITLTRGDRIFHMTFWRVDGKVTKPGTSGVPVIPDCEPTQITPDILLSSTIPEAVKKRDGLMAYRLLSALSHPFTRIRLTLGLVLLLSIVFIAVNLVAARWQWLGANADAVNILLGAAQVVIGLFGLNLWGRWRVK